MGGTTRSDEFLVKFQTAFDPPLIFGKPFSPKSSQMKNIIQKMINGTTSCKICEIRFTTTISKNTVRKDKLQNCCPERQIAKKVAGNDNLQKMIHLENLQIYCSKQQFANKLNRT